MKKMFSSIAILLIIMPLSSCGSSNPSYIQINQEILSKGEPTSESSMNEWTYSADGQYIKSLMNSDQDFTLLFSSDYCSHCREAKPSIIRYIYETKAMIYYIQTDAFEDIYVEYEKIYNNSLGNPSASLVTPTLMFFKGRTLVNYVTGNDRLLNIISTTNLFNAQTRITNVSHIDTLMGLSEYVASNPDSLLYFYDINDTTAINAYTNVLKEKSNKSDKKSAIVDMNSLSDTDRLELISQYDLSSEYRPELIAYVNGLKQDKFTYAEIDSDLIEYVQQYL
ncbi:MAG: hypothetical protein WC366_00980 [Bacilli bacterium]|jgi:predicted bacteriocin transport accessory protein